MAARRHSYPLVGVLMALAAPVGWLVLSALAAGVAPSWSFGVERVEADPMVFGYLLGSALLVFLPLGWLLGKKEDELRTSSVTDALTGLANRRLLTERTLLELKRASRENKPFTIMLLDLDGLKRINDERGHEAGDRALRAVALSLMNTCRATDTAGRFGGDEFLVLAPATTSGEAYGLARRIRKNLRAICSAAEDFPEVRVSIGIAEVPPGLACAAADLQAAADAALYEAKAAGKDRAVISDRPGPVAAGPAATQQYRKQSWSN